MITSILLTLQLAAQRAWLQARIADLDYHVTHANAYPGTSSIDVCSTVLERDNLTRRLARLPANRCAEALASVLRPDAALYAVCALAIAYLVADAAGLIIRTT